MSVFKYIASIAAAATATLLAPTSADAQQSNSAPVAAADIGGLAQCTADTIQELTRVKKKDTVHFTGAVGTDRYGQPIYTLRGIYNDASLKGNYATQSEITFTLDENRQATGDIQLRVNETRFLKDAAARLNPVDPKTGLQTMLGAYSSDPNEITTSVSNITDGQAVDPKILRHKRGMDERQSKLKPGDVQYTDGHKLSQAIAAKCASLIKPKP